MGVLTRPLPKWSLMYVLGQPITREQAGEVILRCSGLDFSCTNDYHFFAQLLQAMGLKINPFGASYEMCHEALHGHLKEGEWVDNLGELRKELQVLDGIEYLSLSGRALSSFIYGPHGWLHWDGNVFTNHYNLGKWPSVESIRAEWRIIAKAFPFLNLNCVLMSGEGYESESIVPVVEYVINDGKVRTIVPKTTPVFSKDNDAELKAQLVEVTTNRYRERGVTLQIFEWALETSRLRVAEGASLEKR